MPTPEQEALELLAELLGATPLEDDETHTCPGCHRPTEPSSMGHRTYCLVCTIKTLPGSFPDNSLRIEFGLSWSAYWKRVETYGYPWQNRKAWTTSRKKLLERRKGMS